jgi:hypothetical protein
MTSPSECARMDEIGAHGPIVPWQRVVYPADAQHEPRQPMPMSVGSLAKSPNLGQRDNA